MKPLLPFITLILLPITLVVASTTGELGDDVPESQLLTNDEMAAYQLQLLTAHAFESTKYITWETKLVQNGLHAYISANTLLTDQNFEEAGPQAVASIKHALPYERTRVDKENERIEVYLDPNIIRAALLAQKKKPRCLIL